MKSSAIRNQRIAGAFFVGLYRLVFIDVFREVTTCHLALKYAQIGAFSGVERNKKALRNHVPDKFKGVSVLDTPGGKQKNPLRRADLFPKLKKALDERNLY